MLLGAATALGAVAWHFWPAPNPLVLIEHNGEWTESGRWRVTSTFDISAICQIAVDRRFAEDGDLIRSPVASYSDQAIGNRPYVIPTRTGRRSAWYEYDIRPGEATQYLIEITAWQCSNGFSGTVGRWIVPVTP
jgi:hypothetical protein